MIRSLSRAPWVLALLCWLIAGLARAQLTIEIVGGGATTIPIAIVPFASDAYPLSTTAVVSADLARSGLFKVVDAGESFRVRRGPRKCATAIGPRVAPTRRCDRLGA